VSASGPAPTTPPPLTTRTFRWLWPVLILAAASALGFAVLLVDEIARGKALKLDTTLLLALRRPGHLDVPIGPLWLEQSAIDLSALGGFTLQWLLGGAAVGFLLYVRRRAEAGWLLGSIVGASALDTIFKLSLNRPRPELVPHLARVSNASFPSGHAMISAAIFLTLGAMLGETQTRASAKAYLMGLAGVLVILIGVSRVYLGVHWPSDVMAGWCFGSVWALFAFAANRALLRRAAQRKVFSEAPAATAA
jgi:undecaprenyl-diphosphatase